MPLSNFSQFLTQFVLMQNRFQKHFGKLVAWGSLSLVLITALVVILRYGFNSGSIALQESIMYNHAILFMLGIAYTYEQDKHVRVDVFYSQMHENQKAWVNFLGTLLFALPVMTFIIWSGWEYVSTSWQIREASGEAGGLAYLYMLKTLIIIMAGLVILQSLAVLAKSGLTLFSDPHPRIESDIDTDIETEGKL
ncbi:TRAP transporter small permease subunit [Thiomicrorhabdus immobilis]|nr:TRAP transporter small permease subunit [Thiomicrorhabdus immobilis]